MTRAAIETPAAEVALKVHEWIEGEDYFDQLMHQTFKAMEALGYDKKRITTWIQEQYV